MPPLWTASKGEGGFSVLLLHGALTDYRCFEHQISELSKTRKVISAGLYGYYPTEFDPGQFSAALHAAQVGEFIEQLDEPVHLVGHSRGGRIALHVAAQHPNTLKSLTLLEPGGIAEADFLRQSNDPHFQKGAVKSPLSLALEALPASPEKAMQIYIDTSFGPGAWESANPLFKQTTIDNAATLVGMRDDDTLPLSRSAARKITTPTLLVEGGDSPKIFSDIMSVLESEIGETIRVVLPKSDHLFPLDNPEPCNREIIAFLNAIDER